MYYLWLVLPFLEKLQFQASGKQCSSPFLWGDSKKVEHCQWTGPKRGWRDRPGGGCSGRNSCGQSAESDRNRRGQSADSSRNSRSQSEKSERESSPIAGSEQPISQNESTPIDMKPLVQEWTLERLRKIMQKASMRWIAVKLNISA